MRIKIRKSDALFSTYIRNKANNQCERCGGKPEKGGLHCSHFWGRARENTRFDPWNCSALCYGCHAFFHAHPLTHAEWMEEKIGKEEFGYLKIRAHLYKKRDDKADVMIIKNLLTSLKEK